ncbi:serine/threonine-protein kinase [Streptomyces sp. V1I1]|uniref:serine/threonine-protein kinase n=1 Tax=Streptomyces sp. V1I1 TaxID=3042272 RepID=UPI002782B9FE|nr:serine/threonine-protein kinase [Streptomyces sp. V1I1]MDQ0938832.1 serine/threonine protein kinase [Streptomyces sp. V1I1]
MEPLNGAGRIIDGRFELLEQLGSGGMGTVWRARDNALHRNVALKEVRPADPRITAATPGSAQVRRERVLREARALARLRHPNVVTIHHIIDESPHPWLVMEFVPGLSLQDRLAAGRLAPQDAARIGRDVLAALRAAHAAGIHHRDVKPANILLRDGPDGTSTAAVLTDFGIAALTGTTPLTPSGDMIGSPEYMAPERIRGAEDALASDLWSLGMTLYVAVEGTSPMRRGTNLATLAAVIDEPVPPPVHAGPLAQVLNELLVPDPQDRPDAARLDALLAEAAEGPDTGTGRPAAGTARADASPASTPHPPQSENPVQDQAPGRRGTDGQPGAAADAPDAPAPRLGDGTSPRTTRRGPLIAAVAVVAVGLIAAATGSALTSSADVNADASNETGHPATAAGPTASGSPGKSPGSKGPAAASGNSGSAVPSEASGSHGSKDPAAPPDDTNPPASSPGSTPKPAEAGKGGASPAPIDPEAFANGWISKLDVTPVSSGTVTRDQHLASVRVQVPEAEVLRSDDYASLGTGYWVIYVPRSFTNGTEAVEYCLARGRTTKETCAGRYLSHNSADRPLVCEPDGEGGTTGRCTRS